MPISRKTWFVFTICTLCPLSFGQSSAYGPMWNQMGGGALPIGQQIAKFGVGPFQMSAITYLDGIRASTSRYYRGKTEVETGYTTQSSSIAFAEAAYFNRGGYYQYGPNDCSIFVCDFLSQYTTTIPRRFTTGTLFNSQFMNNRGFYQVPDIYSGAQEFDLIVFRYYDVDFDAQGGHCGIVVWKNGQLCVQHNSSSNKGLAWTPIEDFYAKIARSPNLQGPHLFRWGGSR